MVLKVGLIGYRNHAQRLIDIINSNPNSNLMYIFHPTKKFDDPLFTTNFDNLLECDVVVISSPNKTHFNYLQKLQNFKGYIFCEKPPVSSSIELKKLHKIFKKKSSKGFFNFNHRFNTFSKILKNKSIIGKLGIINHINIVSSHGLAFKKEYSSSWRANGKNNLHNILETVTIHYVDLLNFHFGNIQPQSYSPKLVSKNGSAFDSCHLSLLLNNNTTVSIFNSYATPVINEISIIGTNGILNIRNNQLTLSYPRNTFNSKGFFKSPPIKHKVKFSMEEGYANSLKDSMNYFLNCASKKLDIDKNYFETSLSTNQLIFDIENI